MLSMTVRTNKINFAGSHIPVVDGTYLKKINLIM